MAYTYWGYRWAGEGGVAVTDGWVEPYAPAPRSALPATPAMPCRLRRSCANPCSPACSLALTRPDLALLRSFNARANNKGWRLDHFLVSSALAPRVHDCYHLPHVMGRQVRKKQPKACTAQPHAS